MKKNKPKDVNAIVEAITMIRAMFVSGITPSKRPDDSIGDPSFAAHVFNILYCSAKDVDLTGYIRRNAIISCESIRLTNPVQAIGGNLDYYSKNEMNYTYFFG